MKCKHTIHNRNFKLQPLISSAALIIREILLLTDNGIINRHHVFVILMGLLFFNSISVAQTVSKESISRNVEDILKSARGSGTKQEQQHKSSIRQARLFKSKNGHLRILGAPPSQHFPVSSIVQGDAQATAKNFLMEHKAAFGIKSRGLDFVTKKAKTRRDRNYVRFEQTYTGIPVFAAETVVQLNGDGGVEYVSSDIITDTESLDVGDISLIPSITEFKAEQIAISMMMNEKPGLEFQTEPATLMIYQPSIVDNIGPARLVWCTKVVSVPESLLAELVLVDAHSGEIALHYSLIRDILHREMYYRHFEWVQLPPWGLVEVSDDRLVREEGQEAYDEIPEVDKVYKYLGDAYDFYSMYHGRDGINNAGMLMKAIVTSEIDGHWSPQRLHIVIGVDLVADDVIAHEVTHGVTQYESGLIYLNESGAIDESFSDMWGEWIDQTYSHPDDDNDSNDVKWLIGEDVNEVFLEDFLGGQRALRNMKDPTDYNDPDRMGSPYWGLDLRKVDNGGVHTNSGVNNKLCYLLTDGDTFNGFTIWGMGIDKVAKLYYEVQTNLLTTAANYNDLYFALIQAAINLEWTDDERQNLEYACQAVEISDHSRKFYSSDVPKDIRSRETTSSTLVIDETGSIIDLNVEIDIYHTWNEDLEVYLISPDGTAVELFTDVGGDSKSFRGTILDDEAPISIAGGFGPFNGSYRPEGNLSDLIGESITGTWILEVTDDYEGDEGELLSWALFIEILSPDEIDMDDESEAL
jgi:Zn-dependent metalloprotease/subtilisin-like proprotein convertase family protein